MFKKVLIFLLIIQFLNGAGQSLDLKILKNINRQDFPRWDKTMKTVSFSIFPLMPVSVIGTWSYGYVRKEDPMMRNAFKSAIAIGFAALVSTGIKRLVNRPRPYVKHPNDIIQRDKHAGPFSFPSGHTTSAFAMATALSLSYKKWYVTAPSFLYAAFVGYSRIRLGMHYPSEVIAGIIIGAGSGFLTWQVDRMVNGVK